MTRKVGIYARVSKAERDDPTSIPVQLADCRERAKDEGWEVVDEYTDEGITGWNPKKKRPGYERLLEDVAAGRFDTILVRETERLLRQMKEGIRVEELAANGAGNLKLIASTLEGDINFARARDRKEFHDRVSSAAFYSDFLSEKVRRTKARRIAAGAYTGGGPAFGYKRTSDGLVVYPEQAAAIHDAVQRLARGDTIYRITMEWNAAGATTVGGARWQPRTLRRMLTNGHLSGANGYPAILDDKEAVIVSQRIDTQPRLGPGRPFGRRHPAAGFLRCAECDSTLTTGSGGRYRCSVSHGGCGGVSIKATRVERYLALEAFRHWFEVRRAQQATSKPADPTAPDVSPILDELRDVDRRLAEVADAIADGTLTVRVAGDATRKLEERRRELSDQLARSIQPADARPGVSLSGLFTAAEIHSVDPSFAVSEEADLRGAAFRERWDARQLTEAEAAQLHDLYAEELDHAEVARRVGRGRGFDPGRVTIRWR